MYDARFDFDDAESDDAWTETAEFAKHIQERLWEGVIEITKNDRSAVRASYVSSLNQIVDLHEKRISALENRISALENRIARPVCFYILCRNHRGLLGPNSKAPPIFDSVAEASSRARIAEKALRRGPCYAIS